MINLTIAMEGSGGTGVLAEGEILLRAVARQVLDGMLRKILGSQIRGVSQPLLSVWGLKLLPTLAVR